MTWYVLKVLRNTLPDLPCVAVPDLAVCTAKPVNCHRLVSNPSIQIHRSQCSGRSCPILCMALPLHFLTDLGFLLCVCLHRPEQTAQHLNYLRYHHYIDLMHTMKLCLTQPSFPPT